MPVDIEVFVGPRAALLFLFEQSDDSRRQIDAYLDDGEVLLATIDGRPVGHVQLVERDHGKEIKSLAVVASHRQLGVGRALVVAALERAFAAGARSTSWCWSSQCPL